MVSFYKDSGLDVYERVHYSNLEHVREVEQILEWYTRKNTRVLDIGCSGGLHALEFAKRGYFVTGVDIEPSAIIRAEKRCLEPILHARFKALDIENDDICCLGKFNLIYSIGNTVSHFNKYRLYNTLLKIKHCLCENGIVVFNVFMIESPFRFEIHADQLKIFWRREFDKRTGKIKMYGDFQNFGVSEYFDVWGYYMYEIQDLLQVLRFEKIDFSVKLNFSRIESSLPNAPSLYFRARN
ncbi:MAG: methyltransferase domain-containing protein [Desulfobacterales bacterium]|jgi:SAM-dependent methyltransferase